MLSLKDYLSGHSKMLGGVESCPYGAMSLPKLALINACILAVAVASCCNGIIAFCLTITFVATLIKTHKLDPEPFVLLSLHSLVSVLMLHDPLTTLAVIVAMAATMLTTGSFDISSERIAVFLISMAASCLLGRLMSVVAVFVVIIAIVGLKLRPLRAPTNLILCLMFLAASVPLSTHVSAILSLLLAAGVTIWCLLERLKVKAEIVGGGGGGRHGDGDGDGIYNNNYSNTNNNNRLPLSNGRHVTLVSTTESLDLHGHSVTSALKTLHQFLKEHEDAYRTNRTGHTRFLTVITGEDGKNHPEDNMNLIKPTVANFLKINKYRYQGYPDRPGILKIDLESHIT